MPIVVTKPIAVDNRLQQLGWELEQLLEVVNAMVAARAGCTDNDPASAPGWMSWKEGTRRMRELGRPMGLMKDDTDQVPSLMDIERKLRFLVSNTDDMTGLDNPFIQPQNRSKRGPAPERGVAKNQGYMFDNKDIPQVAPH